MPNVTHFLAIGKKHATLGVLFALLIGLVVVGESVPAAVSAPVISQSELVEPVVLTIATSTAPISLYIPRLDLRTTFGTELGIQNNGEVEVPTGYDEVGWYKHSPVPGELGPSVVIGHVDSRDGPAVFFSLGQLVAGDEIIIERTDGEIVTFEVIDSERYEQKSFPTELVYGDLDHVGLRLITCSGWYDQETNRYSHNRVVYARAVSG